MFFAERAENAYFGGREFFKIHHCSASGENFNLQRVPERCANRQKSGQVDHDGEPEKSLIRVFGGFVAQKLLRQDAAWPAADQTEADQGSFGNAPFALARRAFVDGMHRETGSAQGEVKTADPIRKWPKLR